MTNYTIIAKQGGKFGVQRIGSKEVHGDFDSFSEACEAIGSANHADAAALADVAQY